MSDRVDDIQAQWRRERPDLDVAPQAVLGRLHRLADRLRDDLIAGYAEFGLGEGEFDVMAALRRAGKPYELAPADLARHTMVTSGAATKRLGRLEAAGLVTSRASTTDGRAKLVRLTAKGRRLVDAAFTAHIEREHRLVAGLSSDEQAQLVRLLRRWGEALDGPT